MVQIMNKTSLTAILCDDEAAILEELRAAIPWDSLGVEIVACASNGQEALSAILKHRPNIAIIDIRMPSLSGVEVIAQTRAAVIPTDFIILSGYDDFHYAKEAIQYGAKAYLLKPLNISELYEALYRIFDERSQLPANRASRSFRNELTLNFFHRLLDGKILEQSELSFMLRHANLPLSDSSCYIMALQFDRNRNDTPLADIKACLEGEFAQEHCVFIPYNQGSLVGIFNETGVVPLQLAERTLYSLRAGALPLPLIGIGDPVPSLMNCHYSYNRALAAATYRLYGDENRVFTYNIICTVPPTLRPTDIDPQPLLLAIIHNDVSMISRYCQDLIKQILYVPMPPPNYVLSLCYTLFSKVEQGISASLHGGITDIINPKELYALKTIGEIQKWLVQSFSQLAGYITAVHGFGTPKLQGAEHAQIEEDSIILAAKKYIRDHITEDLKLEDIAREVHLSPAYFAIYFKNKSGVNLRDHILNEKMEFARRELLDPDFPVTEVAFKIGYRDYRSFSRAFKKIHGMTPSDFQAKFKQS